ncbi:MAG: LLM class flavin-dependent oxidoreductase [Propionibacteriaceae bacterium]|nr:LLM class flavin-dependent oxidoreductase [Propionibacteriaceae bacterium]
MQFGILTLADVTRDPVTGMTMSHAARIDEIRLIAKVAEEVGLDVFALGEHHDSHFVGSSPPTILAAIAAETTKITVTTAATLITNNDPVRIAEEYALLQHIAHGRADLMIGCGGSALMYPWQGDDFPVGLDIATENYYLLRRLWHEESVEWEGEYHTPLVSFTSTPRPLDGVPPFVWHQGHSIDIADQAGFYGDGFFANNMNSLRKDVALVAHYRQAYEKYNHGPATGAPVSLGGQIFVGRTTQDAFAGLRPYCNANAMYSMNLEDAALHTSLAVGSPAQVIEKILKMRELYGDYQRQLFLVDPGGMPLWAVLEQLEILGGAVAPALKKEFDARRPALVPSDPPTHESRVRQPTPTQ